MKVTANRQKIKKEDIFKQGNLVYHLTNEMVVIVNKATKKSFSGVVLSEQKYLDISDTYNFRVGKLVNLDKEKFGQFYGTITLTKNY